MKSQEILNLEQFVAGLEYHAFELLAVAAECLAGLGQGLELEFIRTLLDSDCFLESFDLLDQIGFNRVDASFSEVFLHLTMMKLQFL